MRTQHRQSDPTPRDRPAAIFATAVMMCVATPLIAADLPRAKSWDRDRAAHLLRRAGFGGTPDQIDQLAAMPIENAVAHLVDYDKAAPSGKPFKPVKGADRSEIRRQITAIDKDDRRELFSKLRQLDQMQIDEMRAWWIERMVTTPRPFEEKMTLFWHGHFTSGHREVHNSTMMCEQNQLYRDKGLGRFHDLVVAVSQNPAMLRYLNNDQNRKSAPNENYARELLELFTMGEGNYTESDIKQAARALTGWTLRDGEFQILPPMHDYGDKTFLGRTGDFDGYDIINIIMDQPQTARHLARRLLVFFVTDDPPDALVDQFAATIRATDFNIRESMRRLFSSESFYEDAYVHNRIKSPVELVVGTLRLMEIQPTDHEAIQTALRDMGQELFQPPNVKGWPGGRRWINTATMFTRYNFASDVLLGTGGDRGASAMMRRGQRREHRRDQLISDLSDIDGLAIPDMQVESAPQPPFDPTPIMEACHLSNADRTLNHMIDRFWQRDVAPVQRRELRLLLTEPGDRFDPETRDGKIRVVSLINALMSTPEYQLN